MYGRYHFVEIPDDLMYLVEKHGKDAVKAQLAANEHEARKLVRREQRKSLNAARREALRAAKANPPINFSCVLYDDRKAWVSGGMNDTQRAKRQAQAFKDAAKMGVEIVKEKRDLKVA